MSTPSSHAALAAAPGLAAKASPYRIETGLALEPFLARCERLNTGHGLPFHGQAWQRAWYNTLGTADGRQPLLVAVRLAAKNRDDRDALLLPLVRQRRHGLWWVEFADASVVDYTAPLLAEGWHGGQPEADAARELWQALRKALRLSPQANDVLLLQKMLAHSLDEAGGGPNPLALALPTQACEMFGNQFSVVADASTPPDLAWEAWRRTLDKRVRKEIERSWRVFLRSPEARFERITDLARAQALFDRLEQQQSQRLRALGPAQAAAYRLDGEPFRAFYRQALAGGLASGQVVLTALLDGPHLVTAMLGVANRQRYIGLRQSLGGEAWKNCSPGRLLDEQTARHLHAQGLCHFDFGIGDYAHKDALRMTPIPLLDACVALSGRGVAAALAWRARRLAKRQAWLVRLWRARRQAVLDRGEAKAAG